MGKVFLYGTVIAMLVAAGWWVANLRYVKEGDSRPAIKSIALFIAAAVIYPTICFIANDFALSGFVHHEGFVVIGAMMFLPLIGGGGGLVAILITSFVKKLGASNSEKVE